MSLKSRMVKRLSPPEIRQCKNKTPLVCLTAYTTPTARLLDDDADLLLVGDSLGMVVYGMDSTLGVTMEMMIRHGQAVRRGSQKACLVVDMPFGSYQESPAQAFRNAAVLMIETGCSAVKLEGGREMAETVAFLTGRGIPVLGHIGLQPQSLHTLGGYRARGRDDSEAEKLVADAQAVADAGAFACVIEGTVEPVAARITKTISIPTIGIGASAACDGQILVTEDMLGLNSGVRPRFVRTYADLDGTVRNAARDYAEDVRARRFPAPEHVFNPPNRKAAENA